MEINTGGITTNSTNVCIPLANASIGDVVCHKDTDTTFGVDSFIAVVGKNLASTSPTGYSWYGVIYGFERGGIMVRALKTYETTWASSYGYTGIFDDALHQSVIASKTTDVGVMRNGTYISDTAIGMNAYAIGDACASSTSETLHPTTSANLGTGRPMKESYFNSDVSGAKTLYGTYNNYLKQTFSIMKGLQSGVFGVRCGKRNTKELAYNNGTGNEKFNAAWNCFYHWSVLQENGLNHWWLPDIHELATMMNDDSFDVCEYAHSILGGTIARGKNLWSSVCKNDSYAWIYHNRGYVGFFAFEQTCVAVPVTLISLS